MIKVKKEPVDSVNMLPWEDENRIKTLIGLMISKGMAESVFDNLGKNN